MKRYYFTLLLFAAITTVCAQQNGVRPFTAAEKERWQKISDGLGAAFPKNYKDWRIDSCNCRDFSLWAEFNKARQPLTVVDNKNQPVGNHPYYEIKFIDETEETEQQLQQLEYDAVNNISDQAKYKALLARQDKMRDCRQLRIHAFANYMISSTAGYRANIKKTKLDIPITGYAYLYTVPIGPELMAEDGGSVGQYDMHMDEALVIITPAPVKVISTPLTGKRNYIEDEVIPAKVPEPTMGPIKNIVIWIKGDEQRVRDVINKTDWKALQAMIGK